MNHPSTRSGWTRTDALVLAAVCIWGTNYSIIKVVLRKVPPESFNSVRLVIATTVFLAAIGVSAWLRTRAARLRAALVGLTPGGDTSLAILRTSTLSRRDWMLLALLGLVGHLLYQMFFIGALARTSVANASLIIASAPIVISMASAALGLDRLSVMHWAGAALSFGGIYLVVGRGASADSGLTGDLLMMAGVLCWAAYTMIGRDLLMRHSPLVVTGYSMAIGCMAYLLYSVPALRRTDWSALGTGDWAGTVYSALFGLNVSYVLWYAGVQRLGSARTSVYSNLVPIVALAIATIWLGEDLGWVKVAGAAAVLGGLALTRIRLA